MHECIRRCNSTIEDDETDRISYITWYIYRILSAGDSRSLLCVTPSNNKEFSALDALASVSACVRDRLSDVEYKMSEIRYSI